MGTADSMTGRGVGQVESLRLCVLLHPRSSIAPDAGAAFYERYSVSCPFGSADVLVQLERAGFTHCLTVHPGTEDLSETVRAFEEALLKDSKALLAGSYGEDSAPRATRWAVRMTSGFKMNEPDAHERAYPLASLADLALPGLDHHFTRDALLPLRRAGLNVVEVALPGKRTAGQEVQRPRFSLLRLHRGIVASFLPWFLPPAFLELTSRRSFQALPFWKRVRESVHELLLREPGSNLRIASSAGFGFFMGLIPLWGYQILLTVLLSHRLGVSKTVALVCAQISLPPLIPFIMYGSLVLGRMLFGTEGTASVGALELAKEDFLPWFVGSWVLAACAGLLGGLAVWIIASLLRRPAANDVQSADETS